MPICKYCDKEVEHVSKRGICEECGTQAMFEAAKQMHEKKGPYYERQQAALKRRKEVRHEHNLESVVLSE